MRTGEKIFFREDRCNAALPVHPYQSAGTEVCDDADRWDRQQRAVSRYREVVSVDPLNNGNRSPRDFESSRVEGRCQQNSWRCRKQKMAGRRVCCPRAAVGEYVTEQLSGRAEPEARFTLEAHQRKQERRVF